MTENNEMFGQEEGGKLVFANIIEGKFAQKVDESVAKNPDGTLKANYRERKNKKDVTVFEYTFASAFGKIVKIDFRETQFGKELQLSIKNDEKATTLAVGIPVFYPNGSMTREAGSVGDQIGLIDFSKDVKIGLTKRGDQVRGVAFWQDDIYIPNFNDNPVFKEHVKDRPEAKETPKIGGGTQWDFSAPSAWQYEQLEKGHDRLVEFLNQPTASEAPAITPEVAQPQDQDAAHSEQYHGTVPEDDSPPF